MAGILDWCGRRDLNPHRPCGPTDFLTICGFRRRRPAFVVWTIPSPWPLAVGAARLVSTPSRTDALRPGLARDCHFTGFPEFEQFCIAGFPVSTQVCVKSGASAEFRHARVAVHLHMSMIEQRSGIYTSVSGADGGGRYCVLVSVLGWFLLICFGFGLMMLIAAASS